MAGEGGRGLGRDGVFHSEGEEAAAAEEGATAGSGASADGRVGSAPRNLLARRLGGMERGDRFRVRINMLDG